MRRTRTSTLAFARFKRIATAYANAMGIDYKFTRAGHKALQRRVEVSVAAVLDIAAKTRMHKTINLVDIARARQYMTLFCGKRDTLVREACNAAFESALPQKLCVKQLKARHPGARITRNAVEIVRKLYIDVLIAALSSFGRDRGSTKPARIKPSEVNAVLDHASLFAEGCETR